MFEVGSVGTVFSGTVVSGNIELGNTLWWGPHETSGEFSLVTVKGIHRSRVPVSKVAAGQCATIALDQQISKTASGTTCVRQPGRNSHEYSIGEVDLLAGTLDSTGTGRSGKRMSEPSMPRSTPVAGSIREHVVPEAAPTVDSCRRNSISDTAVRRSSDGAPVSISGQATHPVARACLESSASPPPSGTANGARKASILPVCTETQSTEADLASDDHAGAQACGHNNQASSSQPAASGGRSSVPVAVPSRDNWDRDTHVQEQLLKNSSQDQSVALSFSDTLRIPSCQEGAEQDLPAAQEDGNGAACEQPPGPSLVEFAGFAEALADCQEQSPGVVAPGSQELGPILDGGRGPDISLSFNPTGAIHTSTPCVASQKLQPI